MPEDPYPERFVPGQARGQQRDEWLRPLGPAGSPRAGTPRAGAESRPPAEGVNSGQATALLAHRNLRPLSSGSVCFYAKKYHAGPVASPGNRAAPSQTLLNTKGVFLSYLSHNSQRRKMNVLIYKFLPWYNNLTSKRKIRK